MSAISTNYSKIVRQKPQKKPRTLDCPQLFLYVCFWWYFMSVTVFFEHGQVVGMQPAPKTSCYEERDLINNATLIVSDGVCYDLTDANSIHSIPVPDYLEINDHPVSSDMGVTGYLDYVLRMHSGRFME